MKRKPDLVSWIEVNCKGMSVDDAVVAIDRDYFSGIVWDIEKNEWSLMSKSRKQLWVGLVFRQLKWRQ